MNRFYLILSVLWLFLVLPAQTQAQGFEVVKPTGAWVTDLGGMLSASEERWLSQRLDGYEDSTSTQIIIVTLPNLNGVPAGEYAVELGRQWAVGQQGQDNGVVILASRDDRKIFIATGYGLEGAIPDIIASRIIQNIMVPNFRRGDFYNGFSGAVDALIDAARGEFSGQPNNELPFDSEDIRFLIFIAVLLFFIFINNSGSGGKKYRRRRRGDFPVILWGPSFGGGSGGFGGGFGGGGFGGGGFGGFGGGGGSFGGGGAGGGW